MKYPSLLKFVVIPLAFVGSVAFAERGERSDYNLERIASRSDTASEMPTTPRASDNCTQSNNGCEMQMKTEDANTKVPECQTC